MNEEQMRGERQQTEGAARTDVGKAAGDRQERREGQLREEAGRREKATGDVREVLFGEAPGAEDDPDGII